MTYDSAEPCDDGRPYYKPFEFQGSQVFLTYSQTTITYADIKAALTENIGWDNIKEFWISREKHQDDGFHWHVLLWFKHRLHNRRAEHLFDVFEAHPNVQKCTPGEASWARLKSYVCKDGHFWTSKSFDWSKPTNFQRNHGDFNAWTRQLDANRSLRLPLSDFWKFPSGTSFGEAADGLPPRCRSLWIWGKALLGKSVYAQQQCVQAQVGVHCRASGNYPYDDYAGQQVIYCDDFTPTKEEICSVLTPHLLQTPVWGTAGTRYRTVYWPRELDLSMIVITNAMPPYHGRDWFDTRFLTWHVTERLF